MYLYPITKRYSGWLAGLFLLLSAAATAHLSNRLHITQYNGLPPVYVCATLQDHDNWVCTGNGYSSRIYNRAGSLLPLRGIGSMSEDRPRCRWLYSDARLLQYRPRAAPFAPLHPAAGMPTRTGNHLQQIRENRQGWNISIKLVPGPEYVPL